MIARNWNAMITVAMLLSVPQAAMAENEIHLSADLHQLLSQEMVAIENGMQDLVPVIAAGEWEQVASIAQKISDSFIMKQKLTAAQKQELQQVLPQHFVEMDQEFHASAGMLAHAAGMKNADVVNFYFFKLNTACVACHSKYASGRFPGLSHGKIADKHH